LILLANLGTRLSTQGLRVVYCQPGKLLTALRTVGIAEKDIFTTLDAALENCEDQLLLEVTGVSWRPQMPLNLKSCTLFRNCKDVDIAFLEKELQRRHYASDQTIIRTGDTAAEMLVIVSGTVEVQIRNADDTRKRVDVLTAGMSVGEMAFLDGSARSADVVSMESVECIVIPKAWFDTLNERNPSLKISLLQEITHEIASRLRQANLSISAFHRS
jgi:hypothetical protein